MYVVIRTLGRIDEVFHTTAMTWRTVAGYFMYVVKPPVESRYLGYAIVVLIYILIILLCMGKMNRKAENLWELAGIGISFWVIGVGVIVSFVFRPLFLPRYIVLTLPCFWLSVCMMMADVTRERKKTGYIIMLVLCMLNMGNIGKTVLKEQTYGKELSRLQSSIAFEKEDKNSKIITLFSNITNKINRDSHLNRTITTQFGVNTYLYELSESQLTKSVYHNIHDGCTIETIYQWLDSGDTVYLIADEEDIIQCDLVKAERLDLKHEGSYTLEDYEFEIYCIEYR